VQTRVKGRWVWFAHWGWRSCGGGGGG